MLIGCGVLGGCGSLDTDGLVAGWMVIAIRNVSQCQWSSGSKCESAPCSHVLDLWVCESLLVR